MSQEGLIANTRRAYYRRNEGLQRHISEAEFVARGYDKALLETLGAPIGAAPKRALYRREPGEDLFEGEEVAV